MKKQTAMVLAAVVAVAPLVSGCRTYAYQSEGLAGANALAELKPFVWASKIRYQVTCTGWDLLCTDDATFEGVGDALQALGREWQIEKGPPVDDAATLNLKFELNAAKPTDEIRARFFLVASLVTLTVIPYVQPAHVQVVLSASRGARQIFTAHELGEVHITRITSLNPLAHMVGSGYRRSVADAFSADVIVTAMQKLQGESL